MTEDIKLLLQFVKAPYEVKNKRSDLTKFCNVSSVWQWTNEPINLYYDADCTGKKVLSVIAGGDHILHAILGGATDITGFDVNTFSKYYADLKIAMVKNYDYSMFWKNALILSQDGMKDISILDPVIKTLPETHQQFFEIIEKEFYDHRNNKRYLERLGTHLLTEYNHGNPCKYAYYNFDSYMKLKEKVGDAKITYTDYMLEELSLKLKDKYDIIYPSNIIGRIDNHSDAIYVLNDLWYLLNTGGVIYDYALDALDGFNYYLEEKNIKFKDVLPYYDKEKSILDNDPWEFGIIYKYKKIERK